MKKKWHVLWLRGELVKDKNIWGCFHHQISAFCSTLPFPVTHFGAGSESFKGGKYLQYVTRGRNRINKAIERGEHFSHLSFLSVPEEYVTMMFDTYYVCGMNINSIHASLPSDGHHNVIGAFKTEHLDTEALIGTFEIIAKPFFRSCRLEEFLIDDLPSNYMANYRPKDHSKHTIERLKEAGFESVREEYIDSAGI